MCSTTGCPILDFKPQIFILISVRKSNDCKYWDFYYNANESGNEVWFGFNESITSTSGSISELGTNLLI